MTFLRGPQGPPSSLTLGPSRFTPKVTPTAMTIVDQETTEVVPSLTSALSALRGNQIPKYDLLVLGGPDKGARRTIDPGGLTIGTSHICQFRLSDPTVSRIHCEIRIHEDGARIVDSGSTNGVVVDGVRIQEATLAPNSTVELGETTIRVEQADQLMGFEVSPNAQFGGVLGQSTQMRRLFSILERAAPTDATVLIQGETGVGKELVARAIHDMSRRAEGPFVVVDCGAIVENLIESELFGHVRGAFSGAVGDRRGLFEEAHGGTLFLDEIGELPASLQPRLLRVLENREVRRIGSNVPKKIDVRVLAATNVPLAQSVNSGDFREDLYYRIAVVEAYLPPLRQRKDDIALLARHFYRRYAGEDAELPEGFEATLKSRAWPGNVRELRNFVERSVSLGWSGPSGPKATAPAVTVTEMSQQSVASIVPIHLPLKDARNVWSEQFELLYVKALLEKTRGNVTRAAELAGVHRRSLQRLIAGLNIRDDSGAIDWGDKEDSERPGPL